VDEFSPVVRASSSDTGPNIVCLLPEATDQLTGAECALVQQGPTEDVAPDQTRDRFETDGLYAGERPDGLPWQAESCIVPKHYIDGRPTAPDLLPADMLSLFGMFSRSSGSGEGYTLPLYYVILANAMQSRTSFTRQKDADVLATLSTMSPSQYVFAGGLVFGRHWWRFDHGDMFGDDYGPLDKIKGRTFYGRSCTPLDQPHADTDKTAAPNYCLGGRDFLKTSWCNGVREDNAKHAFAANDTSLIDMFLMKQNQAAYDELPDTAVLVVGLCAEKYPGDLPLQAACVNEASEEFVSRANTCAGLPNKDGVLLGGKGVLPGKNCKASQSAQRNPNLYTETGEGTMASPNLPCKTQTMHGEEYYVFSDSAPKLSGFYHNLFYAALADGGSAQTREASPSERFPNGISPEEYTLPGFFMQDAPNAGTILATFGVSSSHYELWDLEEVGAAVQLCTALAGLTIRRRTCRTITVQRISLFVGSRTTPACTWPAVSPSHARLSSAE